MFVLARALTYSSLFIGFLLVFLPARILSRAGIERPSSFGTVQAIGSVFGITGVFLAIWCILTFVLEGRGTPAPFDPPRQLVANGPYRFVRNPMYLGALFALVGAALYLAPGAFSGTEWSSASRHKCSCWRMKSQFCEEPLAALTRSTAEASRAGCHAGRSVRVLLCRRSVALWSSLARFTEVLHNPSLQRTRYVSRFAANSARR